jgi:hypothetical protein
MIQDQIKDVRAKIISRITRDMANYTIPITNIIFGDRTRTHSFKPPLIWILPVQGPIGDQGFALHEDWAMNFWIISVIMNKEPITGRDQAEAIAIEASASVLKNDAGKIDRHLDNLVADMIRLTFSPGEARAAGGDESIHGCGVQLRAILINEEVG